MSIKCCLNCKTRHTACHDGCFEYKLEKKKLVAANKAERDSKFSGYANFHGGLKYYSNSSKSRGKD